MFVLACEAQCRGAVGDIVIGGNRRELRAELLRLMIAAPGHAWRNDVEKREAVMPDGQLHQLRRPLHVAREATAYPARAERNRERARIDGHLRIAVDR